MVCRVTVLHNNQRSKHRCQARCNICVSRPEWPEGRYRLGKPASPRRRHSNPGRYRKSRRGQNADCNTSRYDITHANGDNQADCHHNTDRFCDLHGSPNGQPNANRITRVGHSNSNSGRNSIPDIDGQPDGLSFRFAYSDSYPATNSHIEPNPDCY